MRVLKASIHNFGSYKSLDFDFQNQGLCLIAGPTGAGKTTLMDVVPWALFGVTAKGGSVDEVCTWASSGTTRVRLDLDLSGSAVSVTRSRSPNDLYYCIDNSAPIRGKDVTDTQRLLTAILGADADYYLTSAYYHAFSPSATFFTLNAKQRRQVTEQLVDLTLTSQLSAAASDSRKELKTQKDSLIQRVKILDAEINLIENTLTSLPSRQQAWQAKQTSRLAELKRQASSFDADTTKAVNTLRLEYVKRRVELEFEIAELEVQATDEGALSIALTTTKEAVAALNGKVCVECGSDISSYERLKHTHTINKLEREQLEATRQSIALKQLRQRLDKHNANLNPALDKLLAATNAYEEQYNKLKEDTNPYTNQLEHETTLKIAKEQDREYFQELIDTLSEEIADLDLLDEVNAAFRSALIQNSVYRLEEGTNKLLTDHFDAVIRIQLSATDKDKLDVTIYKDGNIASYGRLSKGQQQLLRMTFAITIMRMVAMHNPAKLSAVFLDELGDGLDEELKLKMYGLLQELSLEYESVFCIDHNEALKSMFTKRYEVSLVDGESQIEEL